MTDARVWRVKAAVFRRIAQISEEVERQRKLLALAATLEEHADSLEKTTGSTISMRV